jgi:hypothetical protein
VALRIEAVTVCVDYADFLEVTLPTIRAAVDDLVVVTAVGDVRTQAVCKENDVRFYFTQEMYAGDRRFSLGAAINAGLANLRLDGWVLVIDSDIVLPPRTHQTFDRIDLDREKLYGIDRVHCRGWETWHRFCDRPQFERLWEVRFLRDFPTGARIRLQDGPFAGYVPCGFFQLWNAGATGYRDYPIHEAGTAEGSDLMHAARFPRKYRELIPEIVGIELGTDQPGNVGVDWAGRRSPEFSAAGGPYRR